MNLTIKKMADDDWHQFAKIRLTALQTDPLVFGSNYERESKFNETEWRNRLTDDNNAIFLIYDGDNPIGMTGICVDRDDSTKKTAILWGSWLSPDYRGKGISKMMYQTRIEWAKTQPTIEKIIVSHRASNLASKYANQKNGFVFTHKHEKVWTDGLIDDEFYYVLQIKQYCGQN